MKDKKLSFSEARLKIRETLCQRLAAIELNSSCALLNYPAHLNIGDHLIWLGEIDYLYNTRQVDIAYACDLASLSLSRMKQSIGNGPVLLHGGGNLGDLWPRFHRFTEYVVNECQQNSVYILPQTLHFQEGENLRQTAEIFNRHPRLTLFTRDAESYRTAKEHFHNCQIILCPDAASHLRLDQLSPYAGNHDKPILVLSRTDKEYRTLSLQRLLEREAYRIEKQDWISISRGWRWGIQELPITVFLTGIFRDVVQRGLLTPKEWGLRNEWLNSTSYWKKIKNSRWWSSHKISLNLLFDGYRQLSNRQFIITDRLHGHIFSTLIGVPHILLPNSTHKNRTYYEAWSQDFSDSHFLADPENMETGIEPLISLIKGS